MRLLLIGGTGFIGPYVVRQLVDEGHEVAVFQRGKAGANLPAGVRQTLGERRSINESRQEFCEFVADVLIDFILASGRQAQMAMDAFHGIVECSRGALATYGTALCSGTRVHIERCVILSDKILEVIGGWSFV